MELYKLNKIIQDFRARRRFFCAWKSFCFLGLALIITLGCDKDEGTVLWLGDPGPPCVTLSIATDTLRFLPGDSACTTLTAIVTDEIGSVMTRQQVDISLSEPELGYIEFLDTELQDTTNAQGRVNILFTAIGIEGDEIFTAQAGGVTAARQLAIRVVPTVIEVEIGSTPLRAEVGQDIIIPFDVSYTTENGTSIFGKQLLASANSGRLLEFSETDSAGKATGRFADNNDFVDTIHITVTDGFSVGMDSVVVGIGSD